MLYQHSSSNCKKREKISSLSIKQYESKYILLLGLLLLVDVLPRDTVPTVLAFYIVSFPSNTSFVFILRHSSAPCTLCNAWLISELFLTSNLLAIFSINNFTNASCRNAQLLHTCKSIIACEQSGCVNISLTQSFVSNSS